MSAPGYQAASEVDNTRLRADNAALRQRLNQRDYVIAVLRHQLGMADDLVAELIQLEGPEAAA